jgi:uncharacterized protein (DUF2235 family)
VEAFPRRFSRHLALCGKSRSSESRGQATLIWYDSIGWESRVPKNILIFSDGTGQAGGVRPDQRLSNVYKLYRATRTGPDSPIDPSRQIAFYDAGLGTDDDVGNPLIGAVKFLRKLLASATGRGITKNITDCYEAILNFYEPGDRIYLFGFSRGAYTARSVAGVMALCGVPTVGADGRPLGRYRPETRAIADEAVRKVYEHGAGKPIALYEAERNEQARRFRASYQSETDGHANVDPYFIGVFDTVASLGAKGMVRFGISASLLLGALLVCYVPATMLHFLFGFNESYIFGILVGVFAVSFAISTFRSTFKYIRDYPKKGDFRWHIAKWEMKNYNRGLSAHVHFARHALSIDETRADFPRVQWGFKNAKPEREAGEPEFLQQIWFAGNHSDIGGSYPEEESRLSDTTLEWMLEQISGIPSPIIVDTSKLHIFPDAGGMQHCEVEAKRCSYPTWVPNWLRVTWTEKPRTEVLGAPVHPSVELRFALPHVMKWGRSAPYRPETLRKDERFSHYYADTPAPHVAQI